MSSLQQQICTNYKDHLKQTEGVLGILRWLENEAIDKSDFNFDFTEYSDLLWKIEDKDYEELLIDEKIWAKLEDITGTSKLNYTNKKFIEESCFDIMTLNVRKEEREYETNETYEPKERTHINDIIQHVESHTDIKELDLSKDNIWADWVKALAKVLPDTQIRSLDLRWNKIWEDWAEALAKVLPHTQIRSLDLRWNNIWADWAKALAKVLPNTQIRSLDLGDNNIWDEEKENITKLCKENNIELMI